MSMRSRRSLLQQAGAAGLAASVVRMFGTEEAEAMTAYQKTLVPGGAILVSNGPSAGSPETMVLAPDDTLNIVAGKPDTTPPPPPPPPTGSWFAYPGTIPAGKVYDGKSSLATFLKSLTAGSVGILDYDGDRVENVSLAMAAGVKVYAAAGRRPWLRGTLNITGGSGWSIFGLSVHYPEISSGGHLITVSGASGFEFAYAEVKDAPCFTLIHPASNIKDYRWHHLWVHDNLGVSSHDGYQDHGFYVSGPSATQNGRIDHCLIENMPRGRNVKIGTSGTSGTPGGVTVDHCTLRLGHGPSNAQVSNGATNIRFENNVLIDSGKSTSLTDGSGSGTGSTYSGNLSDRATGPNTAHLKDAGGNVVKAAANLMDYALNGKSGKGHLG